MAWNYPLLVALRFGDWHQVWQLQREAPQPYGSKWLYGGFNDFEIVQTHLFK